MGSAPAPRKGASKGGKGDKGKGKGKGDKGKRKGAASFNSSFWVNKQDSENRVQLDGSFTGTIAKYIFKQGWGFILPDDPESLPDEARKALADAHTKAEKEGKKVSDPNHIYFRKPDVDPELFPLKDETAVTFEVYTD